MILISDGEAQKFYYLHRDYLGSIVMLTDENGNIAERRHFDAWGQPIKVEDGAGKVLKGLTLLDRGFTGHEHLQTVGLIHMNGRLYDPALHRFLQPDNYVQDPFNTQNFNRYGYCLNNPLVYVGQNGEFIGTILTYMWEIIENTFTHGVNFHHYDYEETEKAFEIDRGMFTGDFWQVVSKWTWQSQQVFLGNFVNHVLNISGNVLDVTHLDGAVAVSTTIKKGAFTLGNYITGPRGFKADWRDHLFVHEYGHYLQGQIMGPLYMTTVAIPSFMDAWIQPEKHDSRWYETMANSLAGRYFNKVYGSGAKGYTEGSENYFDLKSFKEENTSSPYMNPRNRNFNLNGHSSKFTLHFSDFFYFSFGRSFM